MPFPFIFLSQEESFRIYIKSQVKLKPCIILERSAVANTLFSKLIKIAKKYTLAIIGEKDLMIITGPFPNLYTRDRSEISKMLSLAVIYSRYHMPTKAEMGVNVS